MSVVMWIVGGLVAWCLLAVVVAPIVGKSIAHSQHGPMTAERQARADKRRLRRQSRAVLR